MRINVQQGNMQRYNAAFHDDSCAICGDEILEGDPIGFIKEPDHTRTGPLCIPCLEEHGQETVVTVHNNQNNRKQSNA